MLFLVQHGTVDDGMMMIVSDALKAGDITPQLCVALNDIAQVISLPALRGLT